MILLPNILCIDMTIIIITLRLIRLCTGGVALVFSQQYPIKNGA